MTTHQTISGRKHAMTEGEFNCMAQANRDVMDKLYRSPLQIYF